MNFGHSYIGTEHILYGLSKEGEGVAAKVLENQEIISENIANKIIDLVGKEEPVKETWGFTPRTKYVLENAFIEAKKLGYNYIGTEHLLMGLLKEGDSISTRVLLELNVNISKIYNEIVKVINEGEEISNKEKEGKKKNSKGSYNDTLALNKYGEDLTKKASKGKLDPVIGRKEEIERIIQILSRRTKNNPCLIGEPGVGKTAVIEGLAQKIESGDVPELLKNKRVVNVEISGMVAGAKYRGDFEERIKKVLTEVKKADDIIIFIDEIHTIVGAGAAEGAIDAANILKPLLARGEIQLVGATTLNEYRKYIEKDVALERRFSPIIVNEPNREDAIKILKGIRDKYENHHNVKIDDEAIETAIDMSIRYITDRFLPDKAIDLIDEASSFVRLKTYIEPDKLKKIEEQIDNVQKAKEETIKIQKFEKAASLRDEEECLKIEYIKEKEKWKKKNTKASINITEENIAEVVSNWTKIPVKKLTQKDNEKLKNLEENLQKRVIGQTDAIKAVSKAIKRGRIRIKRP